MTTSDSRIALLDEAKRIVCGDRDQEYGAPEDSFADIATGWSVILGVPVEAHQVALCMDWLKTVRLIRTPEHYDSVVDKAGYAACYASCIAARKV